LEHAKNWRHLGLVQQQSYFIGRGAARAQGGEPANQATWESLAPPRALQSWSEF